MEVLRKYNVQKTIYFPLIETGGEDYTGAAVHVAGDSQRSFDGAAPNNSTNAFAHVANGIYSLVLTAAEHQAEIIVITIIDQTGPKVWQDQTIIVQTYGNPAASFAFDLDTATVVASSVTGNVGGNVVGNVNGTVGSVVGNVGGNVVGTVASVVGAVGSVTGNVGGNVVGTVASVVGSVGGNVAGNVNGNVVGSVGSVVGAVGSVTGAVGSVTGNVGGNVGGNVIGSVGSVAAGGITAPSFGAGAIDAAAIAPNAIGASEIATDAIGADELAASAVTEIADGVLDEVYEGTETFRQYLRLTRSALVGLLSRLGNVLRFRDRADSKDRIVETTNADEERVIVVTDVTP